MCFPWAICRRSLLLLLATMFVGFELASSLAARFSGGPLELEVSPNKVAVVVPFFYPKSPPDSPSAPPSCPPAGEACSPAATGSAPWGVRSAAAMAGSGFVASHRHYISPHLRRHRLVNVAVCSAEFQDPHLASAPTPRSIGEVEVYSEHAGVCPTKFLESPVMTYARGFPLHRQPLLPSMEHMRPFRLAVWLSSIAGSSSSRHRRRLASSGVVVLVFSVQVANMQELLPTRVLFGGLRVLPFVCVVCDVVFYTLCESAFVPVLY